MPASASASCSWRTTVSLDRRIRDELEHDAERVVVDVERNLRQVEARAGRRSRIGSLAPLAAAAVVVLVLVVRFGPGLTGTGGPGPSPNQGSPTPTASPFHCPAAGGSCLGSLQPGTFTTGRFTPQLSYTVPAGWVNTQDTLGQVDLSYSAGGTYTYPDGSTYHDGISIFRRPVAESATVIAPLEGIGKTASELATWLDGHVDLDATGLGPVSIGGALGYRIELALPEGTRTSPDHCTTDHGEPRCVSLFIGDDPAARFGFGIVGPESAIVYLVDTPSGDTVMIVIDDVDGVDRAGLVAAATPIVESIAFAVASSPAPSAPSAPTAQ
jgi:hypothetical protein